MRTGKLSPDELKEAVLDVIVKRRAEIISGAKLGADCATFGQSGAYVVHTDPITGETPDIGSLAITVSANDVVAGGGEPFLALITVIAPPNASVADIKKVMLDAESEAARQNIEIAGGHTEFSSSVNRFVLSATVIGKTVYDVSGLRPSAGDYILMTKTAALEGTAILASSYGKKIGLSAAEIEEAAGYKSLLSIIKDGEAAFSAGVTSLHDATEGGIIGAVTELAEGAGVGADIYVDEIAATPLTQRVCSALGIDYRRLVSSGSLIVTAREGAEAVEKFARFGVKATIIGKITQSGVYAVRNNSKGEKLSSSPDELFKL